MNVVVIWNTAPPAARRVPSRLFFDPEDGGDTSVHTNYKALYPRSQHCLAFCHQFKGVLRKESSGMLHRVALVRTYVSEEPGASFIRVTRIGELGTTQALTSNPRTPVASCSLCCS
jgi:hypothetical protein